MLRDRCPATVNFALKYCNAKERWIDHAYSQFIKIYGWVSNWVRWFMKRFAYIENTYKISRSCGKDEFDCKVEIIQKYLSSKLPTEDDDEETKAKKLKEVNKLTDYLVKCINEV